MRTVRCHSCHSQPLGNTWRWQNHILVNICVERTIKQCTCEWKNWWDVQRVLTIEPWKTRQFKLGEYRAHQTRTARCRTSEPQHERHVAAMLITPCSILLFLAMLLVWHVLEQGAIGKNDIAWDFFLFDFPYLRYVQKEGTEGIRGQSVRAV